MEPLDLTARAPRDPREGLGGLVLLPRTIDKARAQLPGGQPGTYFIGPGMSAILLAKLGIAEADFIALVGTAKDENEVAARVLNGVVPERIARWNAMFENLRVEHITPDIRPTFDQLYGKRQPDELVFDVLNADDAAMFANR